MRGKSSKHNGSGGRRAKSSSHASTAGNGSATMNQEELTELIYQTLETEIGGVEVYATALECVQNEDLKEEFEKYHEETKRHVEAVRGLCESLALDPGEETPGRLIVRHKGEALITAMKEALKAGNPGAAEIVAVECVVDAETKDHANWELIGEIVKKSKSESAGALKKAYDEIEEQEDEHLYHSKGWARELWIQALGMKPVLPPPEEEKDVHSAIEASRARHARERMM